MPTTSQLLSPAIGLICLVFAGCFSKDLETDLAAVYGDVAKFEHPDRDPVIVIPGVLGTRLIDGPSRKIVWGAFTRESIDPNVADEARMLALPMTLGQPLAALVDATVPDGALESLEIELFPGVKIEATAYAQILGLLGAGGYRDQTLGEAGAIDYGDDHYTCFQFDYDWRRSLTENAAELARFIEDVRDYVGQKNLEKFGRRGEFEVDLVAHSLGALISRYYLMYGDQSVEHGPPTLDWRGASGIGDVILIGPPNSGSAYSLEQLTEGLQYASLLPKFEPALLGTLPVIYELLPRDRDRMVTDSSGAPVDLYDLATWERLSWGLANPEQDPVLEKLLPEESTSRARRRVALEHLDKCLTNAKRVHAALDRPATAPDGLHLTLWAGDSTDTPARAQHDGKTGVEFIHDLPGDGLVTRYSALADNRIGGNGEPQFLDSPIDWTTVTFLFASHLELTKRREFADSLLFELLEHD